MRKKPRYNVFGITFQNRFKLNCARSIGLNQHDISDGFKDVLGNTALHYIAGVNTNAPLFSSCQEIEATLDHLMTLEGTDINVQNHYGQTPLHIVPITEIAH